VARPGLSGTPKLAAQARLGFDGGLAVSSFGGPDLAQGWHSRSGGLGGGFITVPLLGRVLSVRPGVAWVSKGGETVVQDVTGQLVIDYFQVAALAQVTLPSNLWIEPHGLVGPVVGFEMKCEFVAWNQYQRGSAACSSPLFQGAFPTKSSDVGLLLGAGATLAPRKRLSLLVEVAYELGLVSIVAASDPADIKNRSLGVRAGLLFSL
jgi:hypothetical protein